MARNIFFLLNFVARKTTNPYTMFIKIYTYVIHVTHKFQGDNIEFKFPSFTRQYTAITDTDGINRRLTFLIKWFFSRHIFHITFSLYDKNPEIKKKAIKKKEFINI